MRYLTASVGYVAMVLAVLGIATVAVFNLYEITAKPDRDWDADIDRIIAQQQERKRLAALAPRTETVETAKLALEQIDLQADRMEPQSAPEEATSSLRDDAGIRDGAEKKAQPAQGKRSGRRTARRGEHFLPAAFASIPKFAATTAASTLLRLR